MRVVNLVIIFLTFFVSVILLFWYRKTSARIRIQALIDKINDVKLDLQDAFLQYEEILHNPRYISNVEFPQWQEKWKHLIPIIEEYCETELAFDNDREIRRLNDIFVNGNNQIIQKNEKYIQQELQKNQDLFDSIEDHPLTENQRNTIIIDEKNNLVVAGAGTGKTSTIIGKAGYLLENQIVRPEELLLISFARKARNEMYERGIEKINQELNVHTFHSLGRQIIGQVEGKIPSISELANDKQKLVNQISYFIENRSQDRNFLVKLNNYFAFHKTPYVNEFQFDSKGEYIDYLRNNETRSLKGDLVKSFEELEIANYLYINGIEYEYEAEYEIPTANKKYSQYKPDFYLPEKGIYIEHFGVDENDNTAPFIDNEKYLEEMQWKREIHTKNQTKLVETYSWLKTQGILLEYLEERLLENGIEYKPLPPEKTFEEINSLGFVHPFSNLISTFLNLYKSRNKPLDELYEKARKLYNQSRYSAFLDIFSVIYEDYQDSLQDEIDFNDMINRAEKYLKNGNYISPYKYVLVDEFQDISYSRYSLLTALLQNNPEAKSFCVGDDWQSIFRFTGSDISIMSKFDDYFTPSEILSLDKTFRFNNMLCDVSTKFILENPNQIQKQLSTYKTSTKPAVTLHWTSNEIKEIETILENLSSNIDETSIFILGRYNHQRPENLWKLRNIFPQFSVNYHTIHSSKGKQADYVIILGLTSEKYSFPSQIEDDPILNLVLSETEKIPNAEERRLFYVAITRARNHVHLIADTNTPSSFAIELEKNNYNIVSIGKSPRAGIKCPECKTGSIVSKWSRKGQFFACNNFPYCEYIARTCPQCGQGFIYYNRGRYLCSQDTCSFMRRPCPRCRDNGDDGYLVERFSRTKFFGCSNFPNCRYTRPIDSRRTSYR